MYERKKIWVCLVCGKILSYQIVEGSIDSELEESCALNSVFVYEDSCIIKNGKVVEILEEKNKNE